MTLKTTNIAELKTHLSEYLTLVERGRVIDVCRRNRPIAKMVPADKAHVNKTRLGCGVGSVVFHGDLTRPLIPVRAWDMHKKRGMRQRGGLTRTGRNQTGELARRS